MIKIMNELKKNNFKNDKEMNKIYNFIIYIENNSFELDECQQLLYHFLKKITKNDIEDKKISRLLLYENELTPIKFINKLFRK